MITDFLQHYQSVTDRLTELAVSYGYAGGFAVSVGETVILPLFPDPFIVGAVAVGLNPWIMSLVVIIGTTIGAVIGYLLGRWLGHPVAVKIFGEKKINQGEILVKKYGVWAVIIAGFTPIPFKIMVWLAGVFEMPFKKYMVAVIIGRVPRFLIVAWLSEMALTKFFG